MLNDNFCCSTQTNKYELSSFFFLSSYRYILGDGLFVNVIHEARDDLSFESESSGFLTPSKRFFDRDDNHSLNRPSFVLYPK